MRAAQEPCLTWVLRGVVCTECNACHDLDLARDEQIQARPRPTAPSPSSATPEPSRQAVASITAASATLCRRIRDVNALHSRPARLSCGVRRQVVSPMHGALSLAMTRGWMPVVHRTGSGRAGRARRRGTRRRWRRFWWRRCTTSRAPTSCRTCAASSASWRGTLQVHHFWRLRLESLTPRTTSLHRQRQTPRVIHGIHGALSALKLHAGAEVCRVQAPTEAPPGGRRYL